MNTEQLCVLARKLGCRILINRKLRDFTTFKVGGECPVIIEINSESSLAELIKFSNQNRLRTMVIGKGSNMLCDDRGFDGAVFLMGNEFSEIRLVDGVTVEAEAGCPLIRLCRFALDNSLGGLEFAYGIPGTVGGAVYMNAGAYDGEIKNVIQSARAVDADGNIREYSQEEMELSYRTSVFQRRNSIITKAVFKLHKAEKSEIEARMNELMKRRREKQPLEYPNAGSTFKRPEGQFAGKLIQDCGLKGVSIGGARVSEKHSGFVINTGNATSEDIKRLIEKVQQTVFEKTGYFLECEVRIIPYGKETD
ncbi:UDP-N-acetylmuramate dehydrogenase [Ruminococcus sp. Marseille-P6503]|uniref:UDP-N-acetylmuramate dehydrogenase n=1 Tax=Ruminococcus sp. Marseille-P6503 TaxID=2364796 RepID=UPI000F5444BE|nr:UDP-N-acetylmuramate dehydrogenase [Ruminococcus sp. Marseille-P6503]